MLQYHANVLLPLNDEQIATKVKSYLSKYIKELGDAQVIDKEISRFPNSLTHFFPGQPLKERRLLFRLLV